MTRQVCAIAAVNDPLPYLERVLNHASRQTEMYVVPLLPRAPLLLNRNS